MSLSQGFVAVASPLGPSQYHHAVAGGSTIQTQNKLDFDADRSPTRYRVVVLTSSKFDF